MTKRQTFRFLLFIYSLIVSLIGVDILTYTHITTVVLFVVITWWVTFVSLIFSFFPYTDIKLEDNTIVIGWRERELQRISLTDVEDIKVKGFLGFFPSILLLYKDGNRKKVSLQHKNYLQTVDYLSHLYSPSELASKFKDLVTYEGADEYLSQILTKIIIALPFFSIFVPLFVWDIRNLGIFFVWLMVSWVYLAFSWFITKLSNHLSVSDGVTVDFIKIDIILINFILFIFYLYVGGRFYSHF